jgi:hypothetical protein
VRCAGSQFDPLVVELFVDAWENGEPALRRRAAVAVGV